MNSTERLIGLLHDLDDEKISKGLLAIVIELQVATEKFGSFNSPMEGLAIIEEEVDELKQAIRFGWTISNKVIDTRYPGSEGPQYMWGIVDGNPQEEAIQVGAMALRYLIDCIYQ